MALNLVDWLFPRFCLSCGKIGTYLCDNCRFLVRPLVFQICPICQQPSFNGKTHKHCYQKESLNGLISIFPYRGIIKKAIIKLKYRFVTDLAQDLVNLIVNNSALKLLPKDFILVPIPLHYRRFNWRGFNQSTLLALKIGELLKKEVKTDFLKRVKNSFPQVALSGEQRKVNLKACFVANKQALNDEKLFKKPLVLFDDVWTTGATLKEACQVLKQAGFKNVWGLTICR